MWPNMYNALQSSSIQSRSAIIYEQIMGWTASGWSDHNNMIGSVGLNWVMHFVNNNKAFFLAKL